MKDSETIINHYINAYNNFDVAGMLANMSADILFENNSNGEITMSLHGSEAFRQQAEQACSLFTEREQTILDIAHENQKTEIAISYRAILASNLPNGMKKGDVIKLNGKSVFTFSGNKIIKLEDFS